MNKELLDNRSSPLKPADRVRQFYDRQVLEHPELPAILGVSNKLAADLRDHEEWRVFRLLIPLNFEMDVLELGCGGGRWCRHFAPLVRTVAGVDFSANVLSYANRRAEGGRFDNITYYHASLEEFCPTGKYDLIYFSAVTLYLEDQVLKECIARYACCLKESGVMVVRDSVANSIHAVEHQDGYVARYRTIDSYKSLFGTAGFQLEQVERAFPGYCLKPVLNNARLSHFYDLSPPFVRRLLRQLASLFATDVSPTFHWREGKYDYLHTFLVFARKTG